MFIFTSATEAMLSSLSVCGLVVIFQQDYAKTWILMKKTMAYSSMNENKLMRMKGTIRTWTSYALYWVPIEFQKSLKFLGKSKKKIKINIT